MVEKINQIEIDGTTYDLQDKNSLAALKELNEDVNEFKTKTATDFSELENNIEILDDKIINTDSKVNTINEKIEKGFKETVNGENIHLTDAVDGKAIAFSLFGKARQNTTSGKNLLRNTNYSKTLNGVTFTVNEDDGSIRAKGTATANTTYILEKYNDLLKRLPTSGEVILSGCTNGSDTTYDLRVQVYSNGSGSAVACYNSPKIISLDNLEENENYNCYINILSGVTIDTTFYPMIHLASIEDSTYEPYTGGIASPSPEFPQDIEVAGKCYNLLENTAISQTINDVSFVVNEDRSITANGTATQWASVHIHPITLEAGTYILSGCPNGGDNGKYILYIPSVYLGKEYLDKGTGVEFTLTETKTLGVSVVVYAGYTANNLVFKPMIRKATVKSDRYMPYEVNSVRVKSVGKNLLETTATTQTDNGITFTVENDGSIHVSGKIPDDFTGQSVQMIISSSIPLEIGQEYIISVDTIINDTKKIWWFLYDAINKKDVVNMLSVNSSFIYKGEKLILYYRVFKDVEIDDYVKPMIRLASDTNSTYEPYNGTTTTLPTPNGLAGIPVSSGGNYTDQNGQQWICDEVVKYADGSGAYIKRVGKEDFANISFNRSTNYANPFFYGDLPSKKIGITNGICSSFVFDSENRNTTSFDSNGKDNTFTFVYTNQQILVRCDTYSDIETFKNAMRGVEVYYELAEPITTPLTSEQMAEIEKLHTFSPITNISNDFNCGMDITYATTKEAAISYEAYSNKTKIRELGDELEKTNNKLDILVNTADLDIKETATGEEIHLTDSADGKAVEFSLFGKARQNTTLGNQLLNYESKLINSNGLTATLNYDKSITIKGTPTKNYAFVFSDNISLEVGTYYVSGGEMANGSLYVQVQKIMANGSIQRFNNKSFNIDGTEQSVVVNIQTNEYLGAIDYTIYPMINKGTIALPFEPYTGCLPSPSPDYPQDIEVAGESYNLLENTATSREIHGVAFTVNEDKSVTVNGTAIDTGDATINLNTDILSVLQPNIKYIYSYGSTSDSLRYAIWDNTDEKWLLFNNASNGSAEFTLSEEVFTHTTTVQVFVPRGKTVENITVYPMIRKADAPSDKYMPYGKGSVEVKSVGKNLLKNGYHEDYISNVGVSYTKQNDGSVLLNNTSSGVSYYRYAYGNINQDFLRKYIGKEVTISFKTTHASVVYCCEFVKNGATILSFYATNKNNTFIVPDYEEIRIYLRIPSGNTFANDVVKLQIELGVATEYEPYKESVSVINGEFAGIPVESNGNYTDADGQQWICNEVVKYADGSGEYIQRVDKIVFDGSETWKVYTTENAEKKRYFTDVIKDKVKPAKTNANKFVALSSAFVIGTNDSTWICENGICCDTAGGILVYSDNYNTEDVSLWTNYLAENPMTLYYELAEPITTPLITEELAEISTFYPITNVSNDFDCGMRIEYIGDNIITTNTEIPIVAQDGELESGDNVTTLFGKVKKKFKNVDEEVATINESLGIERLCGTSKTSNARIYKKSTQVYLEIGTNGSYASIANLINYVLPEHARPLEGVRIPAIVATSDTKRYFGEVLFKTDGTISVAYIPTYGEIQYSGITEGYVTANGSFTTV